MITPELMNVLIDKARDGALQGVVNVDGRSLNVADVIVFFANEFEARREQQSALLAVLDSEWNVRFARLRAENEALRHVLADIREWATHDHVMRFDDGDVPLADYCTQAIQGEKP